MGFLRTVLQIGAMMDWATPAVNISRKARGMTPILFEDHELQGAERICKRYGGKGLDITWDGGWSMMVPDKDVDACRKDMAELREMYESYGW